MFRHGENYTTRGGVSTYEENASLDNEMDGGCSTRGGLGVHFRKKNSDCMLLPRALINFEKNLSCFFLCFCVELNCLSAVQWGSALRICTKMHRNRMGRSECGCIFRVAILNAMRYGDMTFLRKFPKSY